jgi:DNA polymerase-3 subunit epsilon
VSVRAWLKSPPWRDVDYWSLDLETSGLDPRIDDILSVGMVPVRGGSILWGERYYSLVRNSPAHRPSIEAMRIHHILPEEATRAPELPEVLDAILGRLEGAVLIVHYGKLDLGFLKVAAARLARPWPRPEVVDTVKLLGRMTHLRRRLEPYAEAFPADLANARRELGLPAHRHHHALYDALATAELMLVLADRLGAKRLRHLT